MSKHFGKVFLFAAAAGAAAAGVYYYLTQKDSELSEDFDDFEDYDDFDDFEDDDTSGSWGRRYVNLSSSSEKANTEEASTDTEAPAPDKTEEFFDDDEDDDISDLKKMDGAL